MGGPSLSQDRNTETGKSRQAPGLDREEQDGNGSQPAGKLSIPERSRAVLLCVRASSVPSARISARQSQKGEAPPGMQELWGGIQLPVAATLPPHL